MITAARLQLARRLLPASTRRFETTAKRSLQGRSDPSWLTRRHAGFGAGRRSCSSSSSSSSNKSPSAKAAEKQRYEMTAEEAAEAADKERVLELAEGAKQEERIWNMMVPERHWTMGTTQFWGLLSVIFVVAYFNRQEDPDEKKPKPSGTYRVPFLSQNLSSDSPTPAAGPAAQQTMSPTVGAQRNPAAPSPGPPAPSRHMQPASKSRTLPAAGDLKSLRNREEQLKREMKEAGICCT